MSALDNQEVEVPCENCKKKHKKTIGWIKRNSKVSCGCGAEINLKADQFRREIAKIEKSLKEFENAFK